MFFRVVNSSQPRPVNLVGPSSFGLLQPQVRWGKGCNYEPGWEIVGCQQPINLQTGIGYMDMRLQPTKHSAMLLRPGQPRYCDIVISKANLAAKPPHFGGTQ